MTIFQMFSLVTLNIFAFAWASWAGFVDYVDVKDSKFWRVFAEINKTILVLFAVSVLSQMIYRFVAGQ